MVTSEDFTSDPENVNYVIRWWVSESKYRYHRMKCRGSLGDFQHDVWCSILKTFINKSHIDASLSTVIVSHCAWTLFPGDSSLPSVRKKRLFNTRMRLARRARNDDLVVDSEEPINLVESQLLHQTIVDIITTLTRREGIVIKARFGIDQDAMTLEQVGQQLLISRERVRQIESKAICKIQHHSRSSRLIPFVDIQDKTDDTDENA